MTENDYKTLCEMVTNHFSDKTYEQLMEEALGRVSDDIDKRPGSMVWNGNAPCLAEMAQLYLALDFVFTATYVNSAPREYLIKRAADRSIFPKAATPAVLRAKMNMNVPVGTRFSLEDINFVVTKQLGSEGEDFVHLVECETAGAVGNGYAGELIPIDYVEGLTRAETDGIYSAGTDEEDTEVFRARVIESMRSIAFGGNVADYKNKAMTFDGVGQVKVLPIWNGAGTVKLILMSSNLNSPTISEDRIASIKNEVDPTEKQGQGYGLAPIGHTVTVASVKEKDVNVSMKAELKTGVEQSAAIADITGIINDYFRELSADWENKDSVTVRISHIESRILERCNSVEDIDIGTTANGETKSLTLEKDEIPKLGTLNIS